MVVILNNSSFQFSKVDAQFHGCWHKKAGTHGYYACMAIIMHAWLLLCMHGYYYAYMAIKNIIYDFGNDFCFQNEEFSL